MMDKKTAKPYIIFIVWIFLSISIYPQYKAIHNKPEANTKYNKETKIEITRDWPADKANDIKFFNYEELNDKSFNYIERRSKSLNTSLKRNENERSNSYNYFRIEEDGSSLWNGKHWKPSDFPLQVYLKKSSSKYYKIKFAGYVDYAFRIWGNADNRIKFIYTSSKSEADIIISFEENLMEKYDENYLGLTDYDLAPNKEILKTNVEIGLLKFDDQIISDGEIKATIIHELGHALGLGHSDNQTDIMYPYIDPDFSNEMKFNELSIGDVEAVRSVTNIGFKVKYSSR